MNNMSPNSIQAMQMIDNPLMPKFNSISDFIASPQALALGIGLLQASGPSPVRTSFGQALGQGLLNMQNVTNNQLEQQQKKNQMDFEQQYKKNQMDLMNREMDLKNKMFGMDQDKFNRQQQANDALNKLFLGDNTNSNLNNNNSNNIYGPSLPSPITPPPTPTSSANDNSIFSSLDPKNAQLAKAYVAIGQPDKALDLINKAAPNPNDVPINKEMAKIDAQAIGKSRDALGQAMSLRSSLDAFEEAQKNLSTFAQGRVLGKVSPYFSSTAQEAETYGNQVSLLAKTLLGMPSNNFSEGDREFLVNASVGLNKSADANSAVIQKMRGLLDQSVRYNQTLEDQLSKTGNLKGAAANFYNQEYNNNQSASPKILRYNPQTKMVE